MQQAIAIIPRKSFEITPRFISSIYVADYVYTSLIAPPNIYQARVIFFPLFLIHVKLTSSKPLIAFHSHATGNQVNL